ncbi:hypothetical protein GCM10010250_62860 [Streptomyces althioticus]|nr:hypothetical protein GCM10010250_62860 [Streptomyces althioticus]GGT71904.1 hypothetical protein GCM10010243_58460 [Streptomyces matensis]
MKRWSSGPVRPIRSIAAIPAFTRGDSSPPAAEPWNNSTRTFAPPGGDVMDIVVRDGSGAVCALAAGPDSRPAATTPAATVAAQARRPVLVLRAFDVLVVLNPRMYGGS